MEKSLNMWDADVLSTLPEFIRVQFPFILGRKKAIEESIVEEMVDGMLHGKSLKSSRDFLINLHNSAYLKRQIQYLSMISSFRKLKTRPAILSTFEKEALDLVSSYS